MLTGPFTLVLKRGSHELLLIWSNDWAAFHYAEIGNIHRTGCYLDIFDTSRRRVHFPNIRQNDGIRTWREFRLLAG
jgi:hypothetical protein